MWRTVSSHSEFGPVFIDVILNVKKLQKVSQQEPSREHHWTHFSAGDSKFEISHSKLSLIYGHLENLVRFSNSLVYARLLETLSDF